MIRGTSLTKKPEKDRPGVDERSLCPRSPERIALASHGFACVALGFLAASAAGRLDPEFAVGIVASALPGTFVFLRFRRTVRGT